MTAAGFVMAGRRAAEALMVDACTVTRPAGAAGQDESTGRRTAAAAATVYAGVCRVQLPDVDPNRSDAGERTWTVERSTISLPISVLTVAVGDVIAITASALDPALVGRRYRVTGVAAKTHLTARRLSCERVAG